MLVDDTESYQLYKVMQAAVKDRDTELINATMARLHEMNKEPEPKMSWEDAEKKLKGVKAFPMIDPTDLKPPFYAGETHSQVRETHSLEHYSVPGKLLERELGFSTGWDLEGDYAFCPKCQETRWKQIVMFNYRGSRVLILEFA